MFTKATQVSSCECATMTCKWHIVRVHHWDGYGDTMTLRCKLKFQFKIVCLSGRKRREMRGEGKCIASPRSSLLISPLVVSVKTPNIFPSKWHWNFSIVHLWQEKLGKSSNIVADSVAQISLETIFFTDVGNNLG